MNRFDPIQARLQESQLTALALVPGPNFFYATGAALHASERENLLIIPREGEPFALIPVLEAPYLRPLGIRLYEWSDEAGPLPQLAAMLESEGLSEGVLGIEAEQMRYRTVARLRDLAPTLALEAADALLSALRRAKSEEEIAAVRRAIAVTEQGLQRTIGAIRVGQSEREVAAMLQINLLQAGADQMAFGPLVVSGPRSAEPHAGASDRELQAGDIIIIDCGATVNHYSGDITRCVAIEPVPTQVEEIHALCLRANQAGRDAVAAGVRAASVDEAARRVIVAGGYGPQFVHRTGHGLGIEIHEAPYIVASNDQPLQVGDLFTVEPGIYVEGVGGVRIEDNLVVTPQGSDTLTTMARDLVRLSATQSS
ncbi:MAG: aminopeptidase P family protein [Anaerolineales bacterium]|nr:aminopeptidase P family protein [Anaerolineales bacterium]MCB9129234.1 aminopeptidase P family protein [Ardenticatenales bacterium]